MLLCELIIQNLTIYIKFKTPNLRLIKMLSTKKRNYRTYEIISQSLSWNSKVKAITNLIYFKRIVFVKNKKTKKFILRYKIQAIVLSSNKIIWIFIKYTIKIPITEDTVNN